MKYFQNVLDDWELEKVDKYLKDDHWGFGYTSSDDKKPIWNFNRDKGRTIAETIASKLNGYKLTTWNINGQTMGQQGAWHNDLNVYNLDNKIIPSTHAFIFWHQEWNYEWGGRLHIKVDDDEMWQQETLIVTPEKNSGILFDASLQHYAEAPTKPYLFRMSVGLKLIHENN